MKKILRLFKPPFVFLIKLFLFAIPKNKKLVAISAWFGKQYADNTKFLFEHLLKTNDFHAIWLTRDRTVFSKLKSEHKPVAMLNSLRGIWIQIRAFVLVSTIQLSDFNPYFLCKCFYLDLDHGIPFKRAGFDIDKINEKKKEKDERMLMRFIKYYSTATSYLSALMIKSSYHLKLDRILLCGKPRNDLFFNKELQIGLNEKLARIIKDKKTIVYMPTHRQCGAVEIPVNRLFDFDKIQKICDEYGYIFIIKKHYYHKNEKTNVTGFKSVIDITDCKNIDSQMLLCQTNILISDYSSVCSEFLLLNRPIIHYAYDYEWYQKVERGIFLPIDKVSFGEVVNTKESVTNAIINAIKNDAFKTKREEASKIYFDNSINYSCSSSMVVDYLKLMKNGKINKFDWTPYIEKNNANPFLKGIEELFLSHESN